ncbi:hypothetical protein EVAR_77425_1 [Eumeta japonica]|uniref:Uncharacterized protein n=1 Tax=Eumeta variegata TaxID=151549 RepID=A0A4C1UXE6_EUMVA|nr:hypothetical protein EVAR_77425_1 [Eumeta japonica]
MTKKLNGLYNSEGRERAARRRRGPLVCRRAPVALELEQNRERAESRLGIGTEIENRTGVEIECLIETRIKNVMRSVPRAVSESELKEVGGSEERRMEGSKTSEGVCVNVFVMVLLHIALAALQAARAPSREVSARMHYGHYMTSSASALFIMKRSCFAAGT